MLPLVTLNVSLPSQTGHEKLTWRDRLPGYFINISSILFMVTLENSFNLWSFPLKPNIFAL